MRSLLRPPRRRWPCSRLKNTIDIMQDVVQQTLHALSVHDGVTRVLVIFCASVLVYLLGAAWIVAVAVAAGHAALSPAIVVRFVLMGALAYLASHVLTSLVIDPRPYVVAHAAPLVPVAHDNGFPSDHTLLAATLTASLCWIDRRFLVPCVVAVLLIMAGRLGIGAHHTIDVLGSIAVTALAFALASAVRLPSAWARPLFPTSPRRRRATR